MRKDTMKPVLVTVDVEGHDGNDPVGCLIFGQTDDGFYGIEYIMDVFDEVNAKVLFFVDFAEAWDYGHGKIDQVVQTILKGGHDIGVHIHPDHMADKERLFLWEYTRDEQYDMIKSCTDLYTQLVGRPPKSFRAGKYGANRDTLDILCELGYQYDFSQFYHQKWCGIQPPITVNAPCKYKSLTEFPVTMHQSIHLGRLVREDKIDIEQMTSSELRYALGQVGLQDFPLVITLFLHSFSVLDWRAHPDHPKLNSKKQKRLLKAAKYVSDHEGLKYISEDDLADIETEEGQKALKSVISWESQFKGIFYTYLKAISIARYNRKAKLLVISSGLVMTLFAMALFAFLKVSL